LKDWITGDTGEESVLGFSTTHRVNEHFSETDADVIVNRMLGHVGQKLQ